MNYLYLSRWSIRKQLVISLGLIIVVSFVSWFFSSYIDHRVVALLLLVSVSIIAMLCDIVPVLAAAIMSALILNLFFIPPHFSLHIDSAEDILMFLMYFFIAMINGVLTHQIRQVEKIARDKEEKANTVKLYNTLLNSLSHELRTPITTILGATDNLILERSKLTEANQISLLDEISDASMRLNQQVENLLNMSRLESGFVRLNLDWCDLTELVYRVLDRLKPNLQQHRVIVDMEDGLPLFRLDSGLIEQVVYNLACNAAVYTPPGSTLIIKASIDRDLCTIIVEDNGNGFPEDEIAKVFDKFYRLQHSKPGGTGLGLSIVRGFVEAHSGQVTLENRYPVGARFIIQIPAETSFLNSLNNE